MKVKLIILVLLVIKVLLSCGYSSKNRDLIIRDFNNRKIDYYALISFLQEQESYLYNSECKYQYVDNVVVIDNDNLNRQNCCPKLRDTLNRYFQDNLFEALEYRNGEIKLFKDFESHPVLNETEVFVLYTNNGELPGAYDQHLKRRLDEHWWYVEDTRAKY